MEILINYFLKSDINSTNTKESLIINKTLSNINIIKEAIED